MASELEDKYNKLLARYGELKTKNGVLKDAIRQHQADAERNAAALAEIQARERRLRDAQQELDSTKFHNQQLSRRVEVLQEELQKVKSAKSTSRSRKEASAKTQEKMQLQEEELARHIAENADLQSRMRSQGQRHQQEREELMATVASLKANIEHLQQASSRSTEGIRRRAADLEAENLQLNEMVSTLRGALAAAQQEAMDAKAQVEAAQNLAATNKAEATAAAAGHKAGMHVATSIDLIRIDWDSAKHLHAMRGQAAKYISGVVDELSHVLTYLEQRISMLKDVYNISETDFQPLARSLGAHGQYLKPLASAFSDFATGDTTQLDAALSHCCDVADYFARWLPELRGTYNSIASSPLSTHSLQASNAKILVSLEQFQSTLDEVGSTKSLLPELPAAACEVWVACALRLSTTCRMLSSHFSSKTSLERRLLGDAAPSQLQSTDAVLLSSLSRLAVQMQSLQQLTDGAVNLLQGPAFAWRGYQLTLRHALAASEEANRVGASSKASSREAASKPFLSHLRHLGQDSPSVPQHEAVKYAAQGGQTSEQAKLRAELDTFRQRVAKLEQEKEQADLDCQLLSVKVRKLQEQRHLLDTSSLDTDRQPEDDGSDKPATTTVERSGSSNGVLAWSSHGTSVTGEHEELIKKFFSEKLEQLAAQVQYADAKAMAYYEECRSLAAQLAAMHAGRQNVHEETSKLRQRIRQLSEELETTKRNYEEQLQVMSDHVMALQTASRSDRDQPSRSRRKRP